MEDKTKLKEYKAKIKEYLSKDGRYKNSVISVGVTCKITKKQYTLRIKID